MLYITIVTLALTTVALVHFSESLYTCIKLLRSKVSLATPRLPETPLAPMIRKIYASLRAQELLDAKTRITRVIGDIALSAGLSRNDGGSASSRIVGAETVTRVLPLALAGSRPLALPTANVTIGPSAPPAQDCFGSSDSSIYSPRTASNASVWLAALQALLGVFVAQTFLVRQLSSPNGECDFPILSFVVCFTVGMTCTLMAYAHQVYVVDGGFSKMFVGILAAAVVHIIPLVVFVACVEIGLAGQHRRVCLANLKLTIEWAQYLPLVSSVVVLLMCLAMAYSFLRAAYMLCIESECFLPREIALVMIRYRGVGLLFVGKVVGALVSATIIVLVATGCCDVGLCWLAQWAIMSRLLATGLWYRAKVDSVAHKHEFWKSSAFFKGYLRNRKDISPVHMV
ncbi:hypothetical protein IWW57_002392 [Coemansia sp. S610]|nr:hypothetical protein IWW57_002392 [Coemansia sp. S610]